MLAIHCKKLQSNYLLCTSFHSDNMSKNISMTEECNLQSGIYKPNKIYFLAFKLNLSSYDFWGATLFFYFSFFAVSIFRRWLCLGRDYSLNSYGNCIIGSIYLNICPFIAPPSSQCWWRGCATRMHNFGIWILCTANTCSAKTNSVQNSVGGPCLPQFLVRAIVRTGGMLPINYKQFVVATSQFSSNCHHRMDFGTFQGIKYQRLAMVPPVRWKS